MERIEKLEIRGMSRHFGNTTALHEFNLVVNGGMFVTILGPSGCGKSTALNCLAGLLELSDGEIILNNKPIQHLPAEKRGFGMVFQNYALFPHLTVERNIGYGLEIRGISKKEQEKRVHKALSIVHLEEYAKRFPAQLSGGQQQRLAIARTIVLEPSLLLLDEPLSNLDTKLRNSMRLEIKRIHEELELTTVYVTHDQAEAMSLSDLVIVMRSGHIEQVGTPQEIFNQPKSHYVADFMGYSNTLVVTLTGRTGNHLIVQTEVGTKLLATSTFEGNADWPIGKPLVACFRPDETLIEPLPPVNHLRGRVQVSEYLGKSYEALVYLDDVTGKQLLVQSDRPIDMEAHVEFGVRPERLLLFPHPMMEVAVKPTFNDSPLAPVLPGR